MLDKSKIEAKGDSSLAAGNDINIKNILSLYFPDFTKLSDSLFEKLNEIDARVMELIPAGIYSRKYKEYENYQSEKILTSLLSIGIPFKLVLEILFATPSRLSDMMDRFPGKKVSTSDLRKTIYQLLGEIPASKVPESKINLWKGNFARKYGKSEEGILIIENDNSKTPLSYDLILDEVLPLVFNSAFQRETKLELIKIYAMKNLDSCAFEILNRVNSLNIYEIRRETLENLVYDLAIQPPHPWLTDEKSRDSHIKYHTQKIERHLLNINVQYNIKHSYIEIIEHLCSLILTEYHCFIGNGLLQPLHTLNKYLSLKTTTSQNEIVWEDLPISKIGGDLNYIGYSIEELISLVRKLIDTINNYIYNKKTTYNKKLLPLVKKLHSIATKLPTVNKEIIELISKNPIDKASKTILNLIEGVKVNDQKGEVYIPISEELRNYFKPIFKLSCTNKFDELDSSNLDKFKSNSFLNITSEDSEVCTKDLDNNSFVVNIPLREIKTLASSFNRKNDINKILFRAIENHS